VSINIQFQGLPLFLCDDVALMMQYQFHHQGHCHKNHQLFTLSGKANDHQSFQVNLIN
jgi:hypothetical protein